MKKFLFLLIPLVLTACGSKKPSGPIEFSLSPTRTNLKVEQNVKLTITLKNEKNISRAKFTYTSSNEEILKPINLFNNVITLEGVNVGSATITVTETTTNVTNTCAFNVNNDSTTKIQQNYKDYTNNMYFTNCSATPSTGEAKLLIIPVWFTDSNNYITSATHKENVYKDIESAFLNTYSQLDYRCVKTYYEEESGNQLSISATVTDWYDTKNRSSTYASEDTDMSSLLKKAVNWAKENQHINLTDYDNDKDGFLDGVAMIYARPDCVVLEGRENNFWAYCGQNQTQSPSVDNPVPGVFLWASYDFMYKNGDDYTYNRTGTRYGNGDTTLQELDTSTFIHETGHMFGLFDYYDYTDDSYIPAGRYTMQDENVSTHDPFSYIALNWADPYIPTKSCTITIGDFATTHDVILLTPEWNEYDSAFDEYILLELYSLTGLNEAYIGKEVHGAQLPNAVGVRVWHVDARLVTFNMSTGAGDITSNVNDGNVYKIADNSHACINKKFPNEQNGSFLCANQNMLQLISHIQARNYGALKRNDTNHFQTGDLFMEGSSFNLDTYKRQFININTGNFYNSYDTNIRLNNEKKLGWSFTIDDITTVNGASTATITLTKSA